MTTSTTPVTVYSQPVCVQCNATYRALNTKGIPFDKIILGEDPKDTAAMEAIFADNPDLKRIAPMVLVGGQDGEPAMVWTGFRPDLIEKYLVQKVAA